MTTLKQIEKRLQDLEEDVNKRFKKVDAEIEDIKKSACHANNLFHKYLYSIKETTNENNTKLDYIIEKLTNESD